MIPKQTLQGRFHLSVGDRTTSGISLMFAACALPVIAGKWLINVFMMFFNEDINALFWEAN